MKAVIGTRGSALALWQARAVKDALEAAWPGLECELRCVRTTGDAVLDKPLHELGGKALFTKELELALLEGEVDLCVHSMKDVPGELPDGCAIAAMLPRADVRDALVCGPRLDGCASLAELPEGARIGTGSLRRAAQVRARFPQVEVLGMRGNVDTRLKKACGDEYDGCILAASGVERLGRQESIAAYIPVDVLVPAAGQGAVGIEVRSGDVRVGELVAAVDDAATHACVAAERRVLGALGGSCKVPVGVYARLEDGAAALDAVVLSLDGSREARASRRMRGGAEALGELADSVLADLLAAGAGELLAEILEAGEQA